MVFFCHVLLARVPPRCVSLCRSPEMIFHGHPWLLKVVRPGSPLNEEPRPTLLYIKNLMEQNLWLAAHGFSFWYRKLEGTVKKPPCTTGITLGQHLVSWALRQARTRPYRLTNPLCHTFTETSGHGESPSTIQNIPCPKNFLSDPCRGSDLETAFWLLLLLFLLFCHLGLSS